MGQKKKNLSNWGFYKLLPVLIFSSFLNKQFIKGFPCQALQKALPTEHYSILFCSGKHLQGCPAQNLNALFFTPLSAHSKACTFLWRADEYEILPQIPKKTLGLFCMAGLCISWHDQKNNFPFRLGASLLISPKQTQHLSLATQHSCEWPVVSEHVHFLSERENVASMVLLLKLYGRTKHSPTLAWVDSTSSAKSRRAARTHSHPELISATLEWTRRCCYKFSPMKCKPSCWHKSVGKKQSLDRSF